MKQTSHWPFTIMLMVVFFFFICIWQDRIWFFFGLYQVCILLVWIYCKLQDIVNAVNSSNNKKQ